MKKILTILTLVSLAMSASAQLYTNLLPGGDFENPGSNITNADAGAAGFVFTYPPNEGKPNGAGVIECGIVAGWGVLVLGNTTNTGPNGVPVDDGYSYANLGLVGGQPYTFQIDMRYDTNATFKGLAYAGFKVEFWNQTDTQSTKTQTGDLRFAATDTNWFIGSTNVIVPVNKTHFKFVPLLVNAGVTNPVPTRIIFDNARLVSPAIPISAELSGPPNGSTVATNYFMVANAGVFPGQVTNVIFYNGATLLGSDTNFPWSLPVVGATPGPASLYVIAKGTNALGGFITATSATNSVTISSTTPETVVLTDPNSAWNSYVNGYSPSGFPPESQALVYEGFYGQADLQAAFSASGPNGLLTLGPAVQGDTNIFWYNYGFGPGPGESGAVGDVDMEANFYVQPTGLNGNILTFKGTNISANLIDPGTNNLADVGWTCEVFIKDLPASLEPAGTIEVSAPVVAGQPFSISLATIPDPTRVLQYGYRTVGPNVLPIDRDLYSTVVFQSLPPPPPTNVFVDASVGWQAYINNATNIGGGAGYQGTNFAFGSVYGLQEITAVFDGCSLILSPATSTDTNWFVGGVGASGTPSIYVAEANTYVQDDSLVGREVIFSGTVNSTNLFASTGPSGDGWNGTAFIKDLAPDYSSAIITSTPLVNGAFSITNATQPSAGRHVQYGFAIFGPPVWTTDGGLYGTVNIENIGLAADPTLTATRNGANIDLSFYAQSGFDYTVEYKTNLTSASWTPLAAPSAGACATKVVSDSIGNPNRYYRLLVE